MIINTTLFNQFYICEICILYTLSLVVNSIIHVSTKTKNYCVIYSYSKQSDSWLSLTSSPRAPSTSCCPGASTTPHLTTTFAPWHHLLLHHVYYFVRNTKVLDRATANVALRHAPEPITILRTWRDQLTSSKLPNWAVKMAN